MQNQKNNNGNKKPVPQKPIEKRSSINNGVPVRESATCKDANSPPPKKNT